MPARALAALWAGRRSRIALLCALCALPVLGGGWLLLRHSRFVAVEHVSVRGAHGPQAAAIEAALRSAAHGMSTLDVQSGRLMAAVSSFPVVRAVRLHPSFPHGLRIDVVEQPAVAALLVHGSRTAVAADGVVLGPALLSPSLPTLAGWREPVPGARLHDATLLEALRVLGAAPGPVRHFLTRVYGDSKRGLLVVMSSGLLAYFGDGTRPHAKWDSLVRVLADSSSAGASYVDVRVPEHPAAGFPGGVAPGAGASESGEAAHATTESTIAALAAKLSAGTGEGLAGAKATEEASASSGEAEASTSSEGEEESPAPPSESASTEGG